MSVSLPSTASAQIPPPQQPTNPPLPRLTTDANGVNPATGGLSFVFGALSTGGGTGDALAFSLDYQGEVGRDQLQAWIQSDGSTYYVSFGGSSETFSESGGTYTSLQGTGSTLVLSGSTYTYTLSDGTEVSFDSNLGNDYPQQNIEARATTITRPDGLVITYHYPSNIGMTYFPGGGQDPEFTPLYRVQSITNNLGYQLHVEYETDGFILSNTDPTVGAAGIRDFYQINTVTAINNAEEYCDPVSLGPCSLSTDWPEIAFDWTYDSQTIVEVTSITATDSLGRSQTIDLDSNRITEITRPQSGNADITISYDGNDRVSSFNNGLVTTGYSYTTNGSGQITQTTIDPALGGDIVVAINTTVGLPSSVTNGTGDTTSYTYDSDGRIERVTMPEGNYVEYSYDSRGNVEQVDNVSEPGSGDGTITTSATYPTSCSNPVTCNLPTTTTDARGHVTNYSWNSTHGGPTSVTLPAPSTGADRPETRFSYTNIYARYKNSSGTVVDAASPVYRMWRTEACSTGTSCNGAVNETETVLNFGQGTSAATNLRVARRTVRAGNLSVSSATSFEYDPFGNLIELDGPIANDEIYYFYNSGIQFYGTIGMDPDGGGTQQRLGQRYTYDDNGNVTEMETVYLTGTTRSALENSTNVTQSAEYSYDTIGRRIRATAAGDDSTTVARTDYSYDAAGRIYCVAQRMNPGAFTASANNACVQNTNGSFGYDRITRSYFDDANRVERIRQGVGSTGVMQRDVVTRTFTDNGQVATVADGNGNLTTYLYDGFDRLEEMRMPNASGSGSSTTDRELYEYDASSNLTEITRRDDSFLRYEYDDLNRRTLLNPPGADADVEYGYDNFGRLIEAENANNERTLTFTYDALSRRLTETITIGATSPVTRTITSAYRADGVRTRITYPDSIYFETLPWTNGAQRMMYANATSGGTNRILNYSYDVQQRPEQLQWSFYSSITQDLDYDPVSRIDEIISDPRGASSDDATIGLTYNPASQIATRTQSNAAYVFDDEPVGTYRYTPNGLNQYSAINPPGTDPDITPVYDERGNLTDNGTNTFLYDELNRVSQMRDASGTSILVRFEYDPLGRLFSVNPGGSADDRYYVWDGDSIVARYDLNTDAMEERYVHGGPGSLGAPLVQYDGSGIATTDRHWLVPDERGSVVMVADGDDGTVEQVNTYGPYGEPGAGNSGEFGYAGQLGVLEAGLFYMRARMYDYTTGRFLQTDPIGYSGGMNLYAYSENDPSNNGDPLGTCPNGSVTGSRTLCYPKNGNRILLPGVQVNFGPASAPNFAALRRGNGESASAINSSSVTNASNIGSRFEGFSQNSDGNWGIRIGGNTTYSETSGWTITAGDFLSVSMAGPFQHRDPFPITPTSSLFSAGVRHIDMTPRRWRHILRNHSEDTGPNLGKSYFHDTWLYSSYGFATVITPALNRATIVGGSVSTGHIAVEGSTGVWLGYDSLGGVSHTIRAILDFRGGTWYLTTAYPIRDPSDYGF